MNLIGTIPDWVAALGAVSALWFAAKAASAAGETNRHQATQIESLEDQHRRQQAEQVAAWIADTEVYSPSTARFEVHCLNGSNLPVYGLNVAILLGGKPIDWVQIPTLAPKTQKPLAVPSWLARYNENPDSIELSCALVFRDASSQWWIRRSNGELFASNEKDSRIANGMARDQVGVEASD